jgi:Na+/proline symporter
MVSSAALFTENIYKPLINPKQDDEHYIRVGRISSVFVVAAGILIAFRLTSIVEGLVLFWIVQAMMGVAIWVSFIWRRATSAAAWASTLSGYAAWFFTSDVDLVGWNFNAHFSQFLPEFMLYDGQLFLPWQMIIYLTVALIVMIGVSLVTQAPSKKMLDRVYETLRTPVAEGEPEVEPVTLPASTTPAPRSVLIDHPDFEIMKPTATTVYGFIACWVAVGALIASFVWMLKL